MTCIVQRKDRFSVFAYDGLDPLTGRNAGGGTLSAGTAPRPGPSRRTLTAIEFPAPPAKGGRRLQRRRPRSLTWALIQWRGRDLNPRPSGYEPDDPDISPVGAGGRWYVPVPNSSRHRAFLDESGPFPYATVGARR